MKTKYIYTEKINEELIKKNLLRYPGNLEKAYQQDYTEKSLPTMRIALILGFLLYAIFGILDYYLAPQTRITIWFVRYAIVCPYLILLFFLSFLDFFQRYMQFFLTIAAFLAGLGIVFMISIMEIQDSRFYYYAGLILVTMWTYTFVRLRFINATVSSLIVVAVYEFVAIYNHGMINDSKLLTIFLNNNFFFISANVIGMFASYLIEIYSRKDFIQRLMIVQKQNKIQEEHAKLLERDELLRYELDMARNIQQQLIPGSDPYDYIASFYKPMEPVGGDLYDYINFREKERIGIFLSDVSGHGVPAALITSMMKTIMLEANNVKNDPAEFLYHMNNLLSNNTNNNFATVFYGIYDNNDRTITYANAGHNPPYIISENGVDRFNISKGLPIGIFSNEEMKGVNSYYENQLITLEPHSKILFYTDGLTEARKVDRPKEMFEQYFNDIALKNFQLNCQDFIKSIYNELIEFHGSESFDDDICLICLDIN